MDVALLTETKLTSPLVLDGYRSVQTYLRRSGGCTTVSNMAALRRVKTLGNYLCWTKVRIGIEEVHFVALYIEPGSGDGVVKTAMKALNVVKDIVA